MDPVAGPRQLLVGDGSYLKHLIPLSAYKIHTFEEIETILLENGLK